MDKIRVKIDVTKIDKEHLYKGAKGTYLDCTLVPTKDSKFGDDYFIAQDVSKEEREKGTKGPIIGNARILAFKKKDAAPAAAPVEDDPFSF